MSEQQLILEIGMGADVHGGDMTKAALRAVSDAIRHSSMSVFATWKVPNRMRIEVTIACPDPDAVDKAAVAAALPYGTVEVICQQGGLTDTGMGGTADTTLAVAGVRAFLDTERSPFRLRE
ncbi:Lin0512 family protein [Jannaschia seohaensis]|uniref:Uncharacterized protein (TIGR02058 family) n=1 Tax=Jannaschia seohaensis TaxID=475081 RepID=A0A2Y9B7G1_9RHOB|nr:Lin0512 family protein [Jannaschia seohaensis]PWJ11468.1 uncharacterized protein (TIGR02058 family) [Jannaschia seohaensis]SSA51448.1 conserved hypothetical protein [Jannaschia seohaensis]